MELLGQVEGEGGRRGEGDVTVYWGSACGKADFPCEVRDGMMGEARGWVY